MRPVLFRWRGRDVHAYTAALYAGLVLGVLAARWLAPVVGLDPLRVWVAVLVLVPPTLFGSRALYVLTHWPRYRQDRAAIWRRSEAGGVMYGGLALALLASVPVLAALDLPFGAFWDVGTVTLLCAMVLTRVGCLLHGCCPGRESTGPLALTLPGLDGARRPRIPTQLLEGALGLAVLVLALALLPRLGGDGSVFLVAAGAYAAGRAAVETTRERVQRLGPVSLNRAISGALITGALVLLGLLHR